MSERTSCPGDDVLVALALDQLTGRDRATALEHLAGCPGCRSEVDSLAGTADQVLLAAPAAEPPAGFEAAVLDRLAAESRSATAGRGPRWRRPAAAVAAAVAAVLLVVAGVVGGQVLDRGDGPGERVTEAAMVTTRGRVVGAAWTHAGDPSWILVSVPGWEAWEDPDGPPHAYRLRVDLGGGASVDAGEIDFGADGGTWGTATSLDPSDIRSLEVVDETGRVWCEARL